ncbi:hypothetical protein [Spirosoma sp.]|uniref:hypothetical protein n=1 Tax=Spirosoma sp. TaxID=1899569 RepID=UPI0026146E69|nr:hypothetical protein [Spirosoma sp.]MCX6218366.1 hypothetical protein [Spirosoma sp.]
METPSNDFNFDPIDPSLFGFDLDLGTGFDSQAWFIRPPKTREIAEYLLKYDDAEKLAEAVQLETDSRFFAVVNGSFYFGDFIEALIIRNGYSVNKMTISTLSMNENNVDSLVSLMLAKVKTLNLIVSDYFFSHERNGLTPYIYEQLGQFPGFQLAVAGTHCKLCAFETECGKHVVIHGSANLRSSGNIEQIMIEENQQLYQVTDEFQSRIVNKYKTINRALRHSKLWQVVAPPTEKATD